jgi:methyl-accepting chemotaxis protein
VPISIGDIVASLTLKDKFSSEFAKAASKLEKSGKKMESLGRDLSDVGASLTKTITLPILAIGGASLKMASDFESSFAGVRKTVNATAAEFAALSQGMRDLSKEIPVNVNELNKIGEAAGQLGIKTENILDFTRVMANLGVATNLSAEEAATSLARLAL